MEKPFAFAERLKTLIDMKGITKSDIARACGIDKSNITRYLNGEYEAKADVVHEIAQKFDVNEAWLMGYDVPFVRPVSSDKAQQDRDEALLEAFRELPPAVQEIVIAQTRGLAHNQKGEGTL